MDERLKELLESQRRAGASPVDTAQACRASDFTASQCAPGLYDVFPNLTASEMAAVLVQVWPCELSAANLSAALESCKKPGGSPAYTKEEIASAVTANLSLKYLDVAHIPTEYGGKTFKEHKMMGLAQGDLTALKTAESSNILVISCLPNDYAPTPGSMIAALKNAYGIEVSVLAKDPAADYRATKHCWISKELSNYHPSKPVPYKQLICFESTGAAAPSNIPGVFAAIKEYLPAPPIPNTGPSVHTAMLSTGSAGADKSAVLTALFNGCWDLMADGYNLTWCRIVVYQTSWEQQLTTLFEKLKNEHNV